MTPQNTPLRPQRRRRSLARRVGDVLRVTAVCLIAFGGYAAASTRSGDDPRAGTWLPDLPDLDDLGDVVAAPVEWLSADGFENGKLWRWSGASSGELRTVTIDIHESATPLGGVTWSVNGEHDRFDRYGPLDEPNGLWHARPQRLEVGDVVMACWSTAGGDEHCPTITVRS